MRKLADLCWPFHEKVLEQLRPTAILCMGKTAGKYVRNRVNAHTLLAEFVENNNGRWRSQLFGSESGIKVIVATHPSIADWTAAQTDPTELALRALHV
jgi:uracil-DNA glycosylase